MNLLLTLLAVFLGGEPTAATTPPQPTITSGAISIEAEFETMSPARDYLGLPRVTPGCPISPSWMVAAPPVSPPAPFDVFSPAVRPPQEFPALFPCGPVALVPCPAPTLEPPAVRHVSFAGEGAEFRIADRETHPKENRRPHWTPPLPYPAPMAFVPPHYVPDPLFRAMWEESQARKQAPQYSQPASCDEGQYGQPVFSRACSPNAFGGPGIPADASHEFYAFPGAKNIQPAVQATYDLPQETAKSLVGLLEGRAGVQVCSIHGDELTITATAPAQMAIATFLSTVVNQPQKANPPAKAIQVKHTKANACPGQCAEVKHTKHKTKTKACTGECAEVKHTKAKACTGECAEVKHTNAKACTGECAEVKCCNGKCDCQGPCDCDCNEKCDCQDPCGCCGKKVTPATGGPTALKRSLSKTFRFYVGLKDCKACPPAKAIQVSAQERKPVLVRIHANADGVLLETSEGVQIRADEILLETNGIQKLKVQKTSEVNTSSEKKCNSTCPSESAAGNAEAGFFQLQGPYAKVNLPKNVNEDDGDNRIFSFSVGITR